MAHGMHTKFSFNKLLFLVFIIVIIFVFISLKFFKSDNDIDNNKIIDLNVNDSKVEQLYTYIPNDLDPENFHLNAYQSKLITFDDLEPTLLLAHAYLFTDIPISERMAYDDSGMPITVWFKAKPDKLQETVKQMYNKNVDNTSFSLNGYYANFENGIYSFYSEPTGFDFAGSLHSIEKAYKKGDELYIIDSYLKCSGTSEVDRIDFELYESTDAEAPILSNSTDLSEDPLFDIEKYIQNNYFDGNSKQYKHTFRKNSKGEYYWYSSEPYSE